jgi:HAD superfamily phosphatase
VPERSVYVGDTVDDMRAAKDAGAIPIGYVPPYLESTSHADLLRSHGARTVIGDFSDLSMSLGISDA